MFFQFTVERDSEQRYAVYNNHSWDKRLEIPPTKCSHVTVYAEKEKMSIYCMFVCMFVCMCVPSSLD